MKDAHLRGKTQAKRDNEGERALKMLKFWSLTTALAHHSQLHNQNNPVVMPTCQLGLPDFGQAQDRSSMCDNLRKRQQSVQNIHV